MLALFEQQAPMVSGTANELNPRALPLSDTAIRIWWEFADHIEARLAPDRELALVSGFANKLPEHAARLAGVPHVVEGLNDAEIPERTVNAGIVLSQYYLEQTLGLFAGPMYSPLLIEADRLRYTRHLLPAAQSAHKWRRSVFVHPNGKNHTQGTGVRMIGSYWFGWFADRQLSGDEPAEADAYSLSSRPSTTCVARSGAVDSITR